VIEDPEAALNALRTLPESSVLYIKDAHRYMDDLRVVRTIRGLLPLCKSMDKHIVLLSPVAKVPVELEKDITMVDFSLPSVEELVALAGTIAADNDLDIVIDQAVIASAKGLTLGEAENALARSLIECKGYDRTVLEEEKLQAVKKSGLAEIWPATSMDEVGGLEPLKQYIASRAPGFLEGSGLPLPRGILLAGLPGSGKSLCAKATASALGMPLIRLDLGTLKGGLVGESEANMRKATRLIDAISPCVVWLDEIEKSLSGVQSSGKTDGGTGSNMFGQLLTWMQESKAKHYIVATCNDIEELFTLSQGALIRRFDDIFFVDLPSASERAEIYQIMLARYKVSDPALLALDMGELGSEWTGAEIEKFVKNAMYDGLGVALANVRPIAQQNRERIAKAREWARYNAIAANGDGAIEQVKGRQIKGAGV
jgi:SpoVK/Ycf46/Vps4 family AAA+-type ATPase